VTNPKGRIRTWVKWTIVAVWACTGIAVLVLCHVYPSTWANASLHVQEISFTTNSPTVFSPANQDQFVVSGVSSVSLQATSLKQDAAAQYDIENNELELYGDASASCTFYNVRTSPIQLLGTSGLTLLWRKNAGESSFAMRSHGPLRGNVTAQPSPTNKSGFVCTRIRAKDGHTGTVEAEFAQQDSIDFVTANDAQLDFRGTRDSDLMDTQLAILGDVRFSHVEVKQAQDERPEQLPGEKTVLLPPLKGQSNEILFEDVNKHVKVNDADLLIVRPDKYFYIRKFSVNDGIQLSLHGMVKDVLVGAGPRDLKSQMPSLFEEWDARKRALTIIPGIVTSALGLLVMLGILPDREKN
jgi:hypothetical protein